MCLVATVSDRLTMPESFFFAFGSFTVLEQIIPLFVGFFFSPVVSVTVNEINASKYICFHNTEHTMICIQL